MSPRPLVNRLMARVLMCPMSGCWLWTGAVTGRGYGSMQAHGKVHYTHRLSWAIHRGPIPDGLCVLHTCDVRCCVNPDHLFLGTNADNTADMCAKGRDRHPKGERHPRAKLTWDDVREIRASALSHRALARLFGISHSRIHSIRAHLTWTSAQEAAR